METLFRKEHSLYASHWHVNNLKVLESIQTALTNQNKAKSLHVSIENMPLCDTKPESLSSPSNVLLFNH